MKTKLTDYQKQSIKDFKKLARKRKIIMTVPVGLGKNIKSK